MKRVFILLAVCFSAQSFAGQTAYVFKCNDQRTLLGIILTENNGTSRGGSLREVTICPARLLTQFNNSNQNPQVRQQIFQQCSQQPSEDINRCYKNELEPYCVADRPLRGAPANVECATRIVQPQGQPQQRGYQPQPGYQQRPGYQQPGYPQPGYPQNNSPYYNNQLPVPPYQQQRSDLGATDASA